MAGELPSMRAVVLQFAVVDTCTTRIVLLVSVIVCVCVLKGGKLTFELDLQKKQWQERVLWKSRANCAHCLSYGGKRATAPSICLHCKGS